MIVRRLVRMLDSRLAIAPALRKTLKKVFPDHWSFLLGEIALYSFIILIITGIFLTFFFDPSLSETVYRGSYKPLDGARVSAAYSSIVSLSYDVRLGLLMRQTHHWAANVFVAAIIVHQARIFFTGAFRRPREINWVVGMTMLLLAIFNGFTGYSLPDDLLSGIGLRIAYSVLLSMPVLGPPMSFIAFGGEFPAEAIGPRLYIIHVFLIPAALAALITAHMIILVKQKHTQFPGPGRTEHNVVGPRLWPGYTMRTLAFFAGIAAALLMLGGLFQINPVWIYGPYEPSQGYVPAQPDWYIGWLEGALRLSPPSDFRIFGHLVPSPFLGGVVMPGVAFTLMYLWPFLEARYHRDRASHQLLDRPRDHPVRLGCGIAGLTFFAVLLLGGASDVYAHLLIVPVERVRTVLQIAVVTLPWIAGFGAYLYAKALKIGGGPPGALSVTAADLRAALPWRRARRVEPRPGHTDRDDEGGGDAGADGEVVGGDGQTRVPDEVGSDADRG